MENSELLIKIQSQMPFFSTAEKRLAEYIIENAEDVVMMSLNVLSTKCQVSEPTVVRFTRKLGLSGYKELKLKLSASLAGNKENTDLPSMLEVDDSPIELYNKIAAYTISSIKSTSQNTLNNKDLEKAADLIYNAAKKKNKIFLTGMGFSTLLAQDFQLKLMRLDIAAEFYGDIHLRVEACTHLKKGDVLVCFSSLGHSRENNELIQIARSNGAKVITVTQFGNSKLTEISDVSLCTSVLEDNLRLASQTSFAIQSIIIETLFLTIALKDYDSSSKKVKDTRETFKKLGYYSSVEL